LPPTHRREVTRNPFLTQHINLQSEVIQWNKEELPRYKFFIY
jgi:hypothetical protein